MQNQTDEPSLILASRSPRRKYLLRKAGLSFSVIPSAVDESGIRADNPDELVRLLAEAKALEIAGKYPESWVIGADTVVVIGKNILGKPASEAQAAEMLRQLSGRTHRVLTGYAICCRARDRIHSETVSTDVLFKTLSEEEIQWYVDTREPFDKAGAYAIQGLGTFLVKSINGSYTNVVGLPVCEVVEFLIREKAVALKACGIK